MSTNSAFARIALHTLMALELVEKAKQLVAEKVEKPSLNVTHISIKHVGKSSATLDTAVDINNPYCFGLPIYEISYRLRSDGRVIAYGTISDPVTLKANGNTGISFPVTVPYNFPVSIARDIGRDWDIDYQWEIGVVMHVPIVGNFTLPLSKKGTLKLPIW
nr:late embryogenesis abundant protein LEA27 [Pinus tabuliformis]